MRHYKIRPSITDKTSTSTQLYLKDISKYPLISFDEEKELLKLIIKGNKEARQKLINSHLRLVISIAKQYQNKGIDLPDLIQCGNIGLIKAIDDFDINQNVKFTTYAVWWIRNSILKEILQNGKLIRLPAGKVILMNRINKAISKFELENGREPTSDEIAEITDIPLDDIEEINDIDNTIINDTVSEDTSVFDILPIEGEDSETLDYNEDSNTIIKILKSNLSKIEFDVLRYLYGIQCQQYDIEPLSEKLEISRERIRQVRDRAIIKLRKCNDINILQSFL